MIKEATKIFGGDDITLNQIKDSAAKDMVRRSLMIAQFKVIDIGRGVPAEKFVSKAKEVNADIIVVSVLLRAAKDNLPKLLVELENQGIKGKVTVMIGGAAVKKEDAGKLGVMYGKTRDDAVVMAKKVIEQKMNKIQ